MVAQQVGESFTVSALCSRMPAKVQVAMLHVQLPTNAHGKVMEEDPNVAPL